MNLKLLKYNIGAAISLTLALWGVEEVPALKKEIQEVKTSVIQVVEKVIPEEYRKGFQEKGRSIASINDSEDEETSSSVKKQIEERLEFSASGRSKKNANAAQDSNNSTAFGSSNTTANNTDASKSNTGGESKIFSGSGGGFVPQPMKQTSLVSATTASTTSPAVPVLALGNNTYSGLEDTIISGIISYNMTAIKADSCLVEPENSLTVETPCSCTLGVCSFKIKPNMNYFGTTKITLSLTKSGQTKTQMAEVMITAVEDEPVISEVSGNSIYVGEYKNIVFNISDVDTGVNCSHVSINSSMPASDFTLSGTTTCSLKIQPSQNISSVNPITLNLGTSEKAFNITVIGIQSLTMEDPQSPVPQYYKQSAKVFALHNDLSFKNVSSKVTYTATNNKLSVTGTTINADAAGVDTLTASYFDKTVSKNLTIKSWLDLTLSSSYLKMAQGEEYKLNAVVLYSDGSNFDVTNQLLLTKSNSNIDLDGNTVKSQQNGLSEVSATFGNITKPMEIDISNKSLVALHIIGSSSLNTFASTQYTAQAEYSDSTRVDVTNSVLWESDNLDVMQINQQGQGFALIYGQAYLSAKMGEVSVEKQISVNSNTLQQIFILPENYLAGSGDKIVYKAEGLFSNGVREDISHEVAWSLLNPSLGTFTNNSLKLNTVASYQTTKVRASLSSINAESNLSINPALVTGLIIPQNISLAVGDKYLVKVYATYADGAVVDVSQFAQWTSANSSMLGVSNSEFNRGEISANSIGTVNLMVTYGASSLTKSINVSTNSITSNGVGLKAQYFSGTNFNTLIGSRIDAQINFNWGTATKAAQGLTDIYSVRWTGKIKSPLTGNITLCTDSDDGVRLMRDSTYIINNWTAHSVVNNCSSAMAVTAGDMLNIKLEFFENSGSAVIKLYWKQNEGAAVIVPQSALYPN